MRGPCSHCGMSLRVLYITGDIAWPPTHGSQVRRWHLLKGLQQAADTDAVVVAPEGREVAREPFVGCTRVVPFRAAHVTSTPSGQRLYASAVGRGILTLGRSRPIRYQLVVEPQQVANFRQQIDLSAYDLVWLSNADIALAFDVTGAAITVVDSNDFDSLADWQLLRRSPWYGAKIWNYLDTAKLWWWERRFARRFSFVVRCSEADRDRQPLPNVIVIPNGSVIPSTIARRPSMRLIFVGELGYGPNTQGLEWFIRDVWPLIRARVPAAAFDIVGQNATDWVRSRDGRDGITVHGFVNDLSPLYAAASAAIAPLFAGGGTRLKILDALAHEVPVVATRIGAFGLGLDDRHGLDFAEDAMSFAAHCIGALTEPQSARVRAAVGRSAVAARFDWQRIQGQVAEFVRTATSGPRSSV